MNRSHRLVVAGITALTALVAASCSRQGPSSEQGAAGAYAASIQEALATSGGKPVLVDFYTDW